MLILAPKKRSVRDLKGILSPVDNLSKNLSETICHFIGNNSEMQDVASPAAPYRFTLSAPV